MGRGRVEARMSCSHSIATTSTQKISAVFQQFVSSFRQWPSQKDMIGEKVKIRMVPRREFAILTTRARTTAIHSHSQGQGPKVLAHSIVRNVPPGLSLMKNIPLGDGRIGVDSS
jgi:hypothetical protein